MLRGLAAGAVPGFVEPRGRGRRRRRAVPPALPITMAPFVTVVMPGTRTLVAVEVPSTAVETAVSSGWVVSTPT